VNPRFEQFKRFTSTAAVRRLTPRTCKPVRYLSVCAGIEAATVAWHPMGWTAAALSEIEAFPRAVLAHHYPEVPLHGDFTTIGADEYGAVDLLVGGTPCQDFSVAGLRAGMGGERGQLTLEFLRLLDRKRPRWVVWENVPGVLSIDGGRAFGAFLGTLAELGYGWAYRVLDAQFFGVPQRRRRVFVVGCLGDERRAAAVLFERASLSGHPTPRRKTRKDVAGTLGARTTAVGGLGTDFDLDGGLTTIGTLMSSGAGMERPAGMASETSFLVPVAFSCKDHGADAGPISPTPRSMEFDGSHANGGGQVAVAFLGENNGTAHQTDAAPLLRELLDAVGAEAFAEWRLRVSDPLQPSALLQPQMHGSGVRCEAGQVESRLDDGALSRAENLPEGSLREVWLSAFGGPPPRRELAGQLARELRATVPIVPHERTSAVRRLTPKEAERLQGFPDDYTLVPYRGKPAADGPRYRALGNAMCVNVMRWIGERIELVESLVGA
jgi:DNA (cytosine-5)-methyltransferase 1